MTGTRAGQVSRNFAVLSSARILTLSFMVVATIYLIRVLQPDNFGIIAFALSILGYANILVEFGFGTMGQREIARGQTDSHRLVKTLIGLRLIFSVLAFTAVLVFLQVNELGGVSRKVILLYSLSLFINAFDLNWFFFGHEEMRVPALAEAVAQIALTSCVLLLIKVPGHVAYLPLIFCGSRLIYVGAVLLVYVRREGIFVPSLDPGLVKVLFRDTLPLFGSSIVGTTVHSLSMILIGLWLGMEDAGRYGAVERVAFVPTTLATTYFVTLWPPVGRGFVQGFDSIRNLLQKSIRLTAAAGIGMAAGGIMVAEPLMELLFKAEYDNAAVPLRILLAATAVLFVNRHFRLLLIAFNHQVAELAAMAFSAVTTVLILVLFLEGYGIVIAALAKLGSELVFLAIGYVWTRRLIGHVPVGRHLIRPVVCAAIMMACLLPMKSLHVGFQIVLGAGVYVSALLLLRVVVMDDLLIFVRGWIPDAALKAARPSGESPIR